MQVAKTVHVQCTNAHCPAPADTDVPLEAIARGVVAMPRLLCQACNCETRTVEELPLTVPETPAALPAPAGAVAGAPLKPARPVREVGTPRA